MAALVLDASVTLAALLPDEQETGQAKELATRVSREGAVVPAIWPTEVANALILAVRRQRVLRDRLGAIFDQLRAWPVEIDANDPELVWQRCVPVALEEGLTLYDATYLELAQRLQVPIATFDGALRRAARRKRIDLLPA
ncbi:MAG: type II toxin-antitoxin system VapC family toxin [Acetobacteraceae bacterium]